MSRTNSTFSPLFIIPIEPKFTYAPNAHLKKKKKLFSLASNDWTSWKLLFTFFTFFLLITSLFFFFFFFFPVKQLQAQSFKQNPFTTKTATKTTFTYFNSTEAKQKPPCPLKPPNLVGRLAINEAGLPLSELEALLPEIQPGGHFSPPDCRPKDRVAIVVPFRNRTAHLLALLRHLHPVLMRQQIEYVIFVVEQAGNYENFNRGKVCNAGYLEARRLFNFDCIIIHDVDLLPEDDRNLYHCPGPSGPRHMSVAVNTFHYILPYYDIFGGVSALTREQFETVNGFPNNFWSWGGEDDDLYFRVKYHNYLVSRYSATIARYTMLPHKKVENTSKNIGKLNHQESFATNGLNSIEYRLLNVTLHRLYTWILVDIGAPHTSTSSGYDGLFQWCQRFLIWWLQWIIISGV